MTQHKLKCQSSLCAFMGAFLFILMLSAAAQAAPFTAPKKLADYLYSIEYADYTPDLTTGDHVKKGFACSAVRNEERCVYETTAFYRNFTIIQVKK